MYFSNQDECIGVLQSRHSQKFHDAKVLLLAENCILNFVRAKEVIETLSKPSCHTQILQVTIQNIIGQKNKLALLAIITLKYTPVYFQQLCHYPINNHHETGQFYPTGDVLLH